MSEVSAGNGGEQSGGGKRPYEPPRVLGLSPVDEGRGASSCMPAGSGNIRGCSTGNAAGSSCTTGNLPLV